MKRDMDLVRTLLLKVEDLRIPPGTKAFIPYGDEWFKVEGFEIDQVVDNLRMLHDGGFVAGNGPGASDFGIVGLTYQGAELLDSIRNPEIWHAAKAGMRKVGGVGLDLLMQIAKAEGKHLITEKLGIPLS